MQKSITVTLPDDVAQFVADEIANGQFASEEEAVVGALRSQAETSALLASTLTPETIRAVREAAAELDKNPSSAIPAEDILDRFRRRRESIEKLTA
jgi:Arc/MetJ-type ribon-helix-helix transcriptional regulator